MLTVVNRLDVLYARVTGAVPFRILVWPIRILLAVGFFLPGLIKALGDEFTRLPESDPVGAFFAHLQAMGGLYTMIGVCQMTAAVLLLTPWTALIGALVYLPVIAGIVDITWTLPFGNTRIITAAMLLGVVFLLCWDWPRLRYLLLARPGLPSDSMRPVKG